MVDAPDAGRLTAVRVTPITSPAPTVDAALVVKLGMLSWPKEALDAVSAVPTINAAPTVESAPTDRLDAVSVAPTSRPAPTVDCPAHL